MRSLLVAILLALSQISAQAADISGRWADTSKSCHAYRSASGQDGTDYQLMDFGTISFFGGECPLKEFMA
jgi:hypothetical protein